MHNANATPPDALLLLSSQCPHCPTVLQGLSELVKKGVIGRLEAVNIQVRSDIAAQYGVRSVPWIRIGEFELEGLHSPAELAQWAQRAGSEQGTALYYGELLKQGKLPKVMDALRRNAQGLPALLLLAKDPDTELTVRIGVSAVLEDLAGTETLQALLPDIIELARHDDPRVRSDACHFLALTRSAAALEPLRALADDPERAVRDVASDSLEELQESLDG
ncbi:MAG: HEAT repeat domain-containing protein [Thiogranum sp.]|nr:HEAT repeat domain-containing protein [Thiogranum sp.]